MKKYLRLLPVAFLLFAGLTVSAQKQGNNWYFANNCALNFSTGSPVFVNGCQINPNGIYTQEGTASISDSAGNLLFYTNGVTVWNRNNTIMPHGDTLYGGISTTQSALIVPLPGSTTIFYVFTLDDFQSLQYGSRYSIVDMSLDNGLGDVIPCKKNILLLDTVTEKLCAMRDSLGNYWVLTHKLFSDAFYAYYLSPSGLAAPVITHIGTFDGILSSGNNASSAFGQMKFSPNGKKIALAIGNQYPNIVELYDFAPATGVVSNRIWIVDSTYAWGYGIEFSPDNSKLYYTQQSFYLTQYDLSAGDSNAIIASKTIVDASFNYEKNGMQLAPDGKIYICIGSDTLGIINAPNTLGTACNYTKHGVSLSGNTCPRTLPSFIAGYNYGNTVPIDNRPTVKNNINNPVCVNSTGSVTIHITGGVAPYTVVWNTAPTQTDTTITDLTPGTYIAAISDLQDSCIQNTVYDTVQILNSGGKLMVNSPTICNGDSVTLTVTGANTYTWTPATGLSSTTGNSITASPASTTTYTVIGTNTGCTDTVQAVVTIKPSLALSIQPPAPFFCSGLSDTLTVTGGTTYTWSPETGLSATTGSSVVAGPTLTVTYTVTSIDTDGCPSIATDKVTVFPSPNKPTFYQHGDTLISSSRYDNQWYRNDTLLNDTSRYLIITVLGHYWVNVLNEANGCSTTSDTTNITQTTGINQLAVERGQVTVYPNPFSSQLTVISYQLPIDEIDVANELGQILLKVPLGGFRGDIDLSKLPNGVYFITAINKTGRAVVRVVKQ